MKMKSPLNSMLTAPAIGIVDFNSTFAELKQPAIGKRNLKKCLVVTFYLLASFAWLNIQTITARADDFELAMVIKETTNPYYNATLSGAKIAAGEIGGTANNYRSEERRVGKECRSRWSPY